MDWKAILLGITVAGLSAVGWGICIAIGFWLAHKMTNRIDELIREKQAKSIVDKVINECNF